MVLHKLRVTTWAFSLLVDVNLYVEPIRRGCSVFCKNVNYSNMSTKVLNKTYIRSYIHAYYQEGLVGLLQQASFDCWLGYPTVLQLEMVLRTRVHYTPTQYTTEDPPLSSYGRAIHIIHTSMGHMTQHSSHTDIQANSGSNLSEYRQLVK